MAHPLNEHFRDMIGLFNDEQVEYLLVGGWAISFHVHFRYTEDIDLWVRASPENATRVMRALRRFGAPLDDVTEADFQQPRFGLHLGREPYRIDILTVISGVTFDEAWPHRIRESFGDLPVWVIGREQLVQNKQASGRDKDLRDLTSLLKGNKP